MSVNKIIPNLNMSTIEISIKFKDIFRRVILFVRSVHASQESYRTFMFLRNCFKNIKVECMPKIQGPKLKSKF